MYGLGYFACIVVGVISYSLGSSSWESWIAAAIVILVLGEG
jgi:putative Mn2+ efflux pump MntP